MPEPHDLTVEILKQIRDELITTRTDLGARLDTLGARVDTTNSRLDETNSRLDETNSRLTAVEGTLLDLAQQQRFVVRHLSTLTQRDRRFEAELDDLRSRVELLEQHVRPR